MMKYLVVVLAVVAGINASPRIETRQERFVDGIISEAIEGLSQQIVEAGLDPFSLEYAEAAYALPVPVIFNARASARDVLFTGASDIVINDVAFNLILLRVTLDISLPKIYFSTGGASAEATIFGNRLHANAAGSVVITQPRIAGQVSVRIGLNGISVNTVNLKFSLGDMFSLMDVSVMDKNISQKVNNFMSYAIPATLKEYEDDINELINILVKDLINDQL